jgi:hypothetical protein
MTIASKLRARGDRELAETLLGDRDIRKAIEKYDHDNPQPGARRHLLGAAVRLSAEAAPYLHETVDGVRDKLGLEFPLELYVYPSPVFNAATVRPEEGRVFVVLSSSLLESFTDEELLFVIGHELGHQLFEHHAIPVGVLLSGRASLRPGRVLELFAWQRYAEISCDRVGMYCAGGLEPAMSALFKLASGLSTNRIRVEIDEFLSQATDLQKEAERMGRADEPIRGEWFATHPFSPLRLSAAKLFVESELMDDGASTDELEAAVDMLMSVMQPSYLSERSDTAEAMRRLLFAGGVLVATAGGEMGGDQRKALEELLGPGSIPRELNPEAIREDLPTRVTRVMDVVPALRRAQIIRDLCVIARADGQVSEPENAVIAEISSLVGVDPGVLACSMGADPPDHDDR